VTAIIAGFAMFGSFFVTPPRLRRRERLVVATPEAGD